MTTTTPTAPAERNGVPVAKLFGTIEKVAANPELGDFRFTARNRWVEGTASRSTIHEWYGAGADQVHVQEFAYNADHPTLGHGYGPTPHEFLLHALATCITAGVATTAAARKIELESIESTVRGEMDVRGILGISDEVRNGFAKVTMDIEVKGDADADTLRSLVSASTRRSAVYDMMTNGTEVVINAAS
ncbi:MAG: OsmC family protein [Actinomycetota bacterium]